MDAISEAELKNLRTQVTLLTDINKCYSDVMYCIVTAASQALSGENGINYDGLYISQADGDISLPVKDFKKMKILLEILATRKNHDEIPGAKSEITKINLLTKVLAQLQ